MEQITELERIERAKKEWLARNKPYDYFKCDKIAVDIKHNDEIVTMLLRKDDMKATYELMKKYKDMKVPYEEKVAISLMIRRGEIEV